MMSSVKPWNRGCTWFALLAVLTALAYWPGLYGTYIFDDFANIVDNTELHIADTSISELTRAARSSPSSEFKRPLSSLSFAANYLSTGLEPFPMKLTNLVLHLLNGLLLFLVGKAVLHEVWRDGKTGPEHAERVAAIIAGGWLLLPINLTSVLYVVQRMESLSHLFVFAGLLIYLYGRRQMGLQAGRGLLICALSLILTTGLGVLAKESAVLLPLYAFLLEWLVLGGLRNGAPTRKPLLVLFIAVLFMPLVLGAIWLAPGIANPHAWARRDFTLYERLLTEGRVVLGYIGWTILPLPKWLSFYHDSYEISRGWLTPWTTWASMAGLAAIASAAWFLRLRRPLFALGVAWFLGAHTLTATVLPLELVFEHRNYFASCGLLLALFSLLLPKPDTSLEAPSQREGEFGSTGKIASLGLLALWAGLTAMSASVWGNPLRLALELEGRAPHSPRAIYESGKTYLMYSRYEPTSPFVAMAYRAFESARQLTPTGSVLPEQALIFMAARMDQPIKAEWWESMLRKLTTAPPSVEDDGAIMALTRCTRDGLCKIPAERLIEVYAAALQYPRPSPRLIAAYGDFAWNVLQDRTLAERMAREAVRLAPNEAIYKVTLIKMLLAQGREVDAEAEIENLMKLPGWGEMATIAKALSVTLKPPAEH